MGIDFPEIKVSTLINSHTRSWDVDLLKALFRPEEAQLISGIPLGSASARDKVIWPHNQSGVYTVKSGYYFLSRDRDLLDGSGVIIMQTQLNSTTCLIESIVSIEATLATDARNHKGEVIKALLRYVRLAPTS
nr:hypothetical protein CFP56_35423 [Quercus suber]